MLATRKYNRRITGISVDGKTAQINRDKVRVTLNGDMTREQGTYWFPFSTVAASSDGSGWYSMPEEGDSIRVYFPTKDEKEAYVITKHDSHMPAAPGGSLSGGASGGGGGFAGGPGAGGGAAAAGGALAAGAAAAALAAAGEGAEKKEDPMDDPSKRNIFTKDGNVVQMVPSGVILSAGEASVTMYKTGNINFIAPAGITINAGKQLSINGERINLSAGTVLELKNNAGSDIKMLPQSISLKAKEIYEN